MEQLSFIDNNSLFIEKLEKKKTKSKILTSKVITNNIFNFDDIRKKINQIVFNSLNFKINSYGDIDNKELKNFKLCLDLGSYLQSLRISAPTYKDENFWDYTENLFKLSNESVLAYIRAFEIIELLKSNNFLELPSNMDYIYILENYSDRFILKIWNELIKDNSKITLKKLEKISLNLKKEIKNLEHDNILLSYANLKLKILNTNITSYIDYFNEKDEKKSKEIETLKLKIYELELNQMIGNFYGNSNHSKKNDCYKILEINSNATKEEIKKAFKKQAMLYHTDKNINLNEFQRNVFEKKFHEIKQAHDYLISMM